MEYLIVDTEVCEETDSISHAEAASVPLVGITAVMMLVVVPNLEANLMRAFFSGEPAGG